MSRYACVSATGNIYLQYTGGLCPAEGSDSTADDSLSENVNDSLSSTILIKTHLIRSVKKARVVLDSCPV